MTRSGGRSMRPPRPAVSAATARPRARQWKRLLLLMDARRSLGGGGDGHGTRRDGGGTIGAGNSVVREVAGEGARRRFKLEGEAEQVWFSVYFIFTEQVSFCFLG